MYRFQYQPLPQSEGPWIRLLELGPRASTDIHIQLKDVRLGQHDDFEALSYSWGADKSRVPIWCNQRNFSIPRSLWLALNRLRHPDSGPSRLLWADAICINQEDDKEKSSQVQLMRQIYGAAKLVIAWLGEEADGSNRAMKMVKDVAEALRQYTTENLSMMETYKRHQLVLAKLPFVGNTTWDMYWALLRRSWYGRIWIVQEVASAKDVLVICGADEILWRDFCNFASYINYIGLSNRFPNQKSYLDEIILVGKARDNVQRNHRVSLIDMLFLYRSFQATDERDKVFALYGLLHSDCHAGAIQPDYSLLAANVFRKNTIAILEADCNLDILSGPLNAQADPPSSEGPSWVARWSITAAPSPLTYQHIARDPQFQASAGSQYSARFLEDKTIMEVAGFILDTVVCVGLLLPPVERSTGPWAWVGAFSGACDFHRIYLDWEQVAEARSERKYFNEEDMIDVYWQTLLGGFTPYTDLNANFGNPEMDAKTFYKTLFQRWDRGGRFFLQLHRSLHWLPGVDYLCLGARVAKLTGQLLLSCISFVFGKRITTAPGPDFGSFGYPCKGRKIFRTKLGYVGLCPRLAEAGDKVAILKGGRVAYALRPNSARWRLLGDAYIHGIMYGDKFKEDKCERMLLE